MKNIHGAVIFGLLLWPGCSYETEYEPWEGPVVTCKDVLNVINSEACFQCAMVCEEELAAAYGDSWSKDEFDGTGVCVGFHSCKCDCRREGSGVCLGCDRHKTDECSDRFDASRKCLRLNCRESCY